MSASSSAAPYQRIAQSLRRRIESGQLRPGDRVPSTRAIARKWGVAVATAAHALNALALEGLVQTLPRAGTIVASTPSASAGERASPELTRARIVASAVAIADTEGLAAVSLRGVASRLGAPVTSLYRHVNGKEELLRAMTDSVMGEAALPPKAPPGTVSVERPAAPPVDVADDDHHPSAPTRERHRLRRLDPSSPWRPRARC
jgi:DNA-binding transcriptional regulator YhcF (GntR family)